MKIQLVPVNSFIYNAADHPDFKRGVDVKGNKKFQRIYSVHCIENGIAHCQSKGIMGEIYSDNFPLHTLMPYRKTEP